MAKGLGQGCAALALQRSDYSSHHPQQQWLKARDDGSCSLTASGGTNLCCPGLGGRCQLPPPPPLRLARAGNTGTSISFPRNRTRRVQASAVRLYGSDSALDHILGISKEETEGLLGQYPPPVSIFKAEQEHLLKDQPDQPENPKVLRVAVIGAPNAGKSTLSNQLLGRKILPVSRKVHTTRCNALGVVTREDTQLVLLDTPGLTTLRKAKRHNLEKSLLHDPFKSLKSADLVLVLVDVSDHYTRNSLHPRVINCLSEFPQVPSVLVLNKVDLLKKKFLLLDLVSQLTDGIVGGRKLDIKSVLKPRSSAPARGTAASEGVQALAAEGSHALSGAEAGCGADVEASSLQEDKDFDSARERIEKQMKGSKKGWPHFQDIFMVAAVNGEDVDTLKKYLLMRAKPGPWEFHSEVLTNQSPQEICNNIIREKLLEYLPEEVPYTVEQRMVVWEEGPGGELVVLQNLLVQKESHVKMLIGYRGQLVARIAYEASCDLSNAFLCDVHLKLCVKLK